MNQEEITLIGKIRAVANENGTEAISLKNLHLNPDFPNELLDKYFSSEDVLVEKILEDERRKFEEIFIDHDFDGYYDAIDILFTVGKEMLSKFYNLSPSVTHKYERDFPEVYKKHIEERINFIFGKIQINFEKGISQGMYRDDVSVELVARLYIRRLMDLHNVENFPPEKFSFDTLFTQMFESFVKSVATAEGMAYYEEKKKAAKLKA